MIGVRFQMKRAAKTTALPRAGRRASLSDMNGFDPKIHNATRAGVERCMFEVFADSAPGDLQSAFTAATLLRQQN